MKLYHVLLLIALLPLVSAEYCPQPAFNMRGSCCFQPAMNYSNEVNEIVKNCSTPYFKSDIFCCIYLNQIDFKTTTEINNGTAYTVTRGPYYGEIYKRQELKSVDPTKDPKLVDLSRIGATLPPTKNIKNYTSTVSDKKPSDNSGMFVVLGIAILILISAVLWRLGKDDKDEHKN